MLEDLNGHLKNDFSEFGSDYSLAIIDDYNTKDISEDVIKSFQDSFKDTGLREICFYYQVYLYKNVKNDWERYLEKYLENFKDLKNNIKLGELTSFIMLLKNKITITDCNEDILRKSYIEYKKMKKSNVEKVIESSLNFINDMKDINITVKYHPYSALKFNPPFHGRYWLNSNFGYIVDGSINTYTKKIVLAQRMDSENFNIISKLKKNNIENDDFSSLDGEKIKIIHDRLKENICNK